MNTKLRKYRTAYGFLFTVLILFIIGFTAAWPNILLQRALVIMLGCFYFFWGVLHHHKSNVISVKVVLEYFFVSVLACSLLLLLTL